MDHRSGGSNAHALKTEESWSLGGAMKVEERI